MARLRSATNRRAVLEFSHMKDLIQKMKDLVQKLCLKVKAEWPSFKRLIDLGVRLVTKKIPKEELPSAKTEAVSLLSQTKTILTLGGIGVVLVLLIVLRSCSSSADDVRNEILAQHVENAKHLMEEQERAIKEERENSLKQAAKHEKEMQRLKDIHAVEAWCNQELEKLKAEKGEACKGILRTLKPPHQIIRERDWPKICFAGLSNLTFAEPIPSELKEKMDDLNRLSLKEKFMGVFSLLRIWAPETSRLGSDNFEGFLNLPALVKEIELCGRVKGSTESELIQARDNLLTKLNPIFDCKGEVFDPEFAPLQVGWRGLNWNAELQIDGIRQHDPGSVRLCVRDNGFVSLIENKIREEFRAKEKKLEAEFAAKAEAIKKESLKKIEAINKNKGEN